MYNCSGMLSGSTTFLLADSCRYQNCSDSNITCKLSSSRHKCLTQRLSNNILKANILNLPCLRSWQIFKHEWLPTGQNLNLGKRNDTPSTFESASVLKIMFIPTKKTNCSFHACRVFIADMSLLIMKVLRFQFSWLSCLVRFATRCRCFC